MMSITDSGITRRIGTTIEDGFLQWNWDCNSLVRFVQSNAGSAASPFAISKVLLVDRFVCISKLERVMNFVNTKAPGTVLAIDKIFWHVAAADEVVKISNFSDEYGQLISAQSLADQCHVIKGTQLPIITPEQFKQFDLAHAQAMLTEPYWLQQLVNFEPCQLSFIQNTCVIQSPAWAATVYQTSNDFSAIEVLTAWFIYIARDTQMSQLQIGFDTSQNKQQDNKAFYIFAKTVPFGITVDLNDDTFSDVMSKVEENYKQLINHLPCLTDILIRHAMSSSMNELRKKQSWALAVSLIDMQNEQKCANTNANDLAQSAHGNLMTLQIDQQNGAFRWIYNENQIFKEVINRISSHLLVLLTSAHSGEQTKQSVAKLNLLPKVERDLLLYTWNQTSVSYSSPIRCLHQLFESQVERDGKAIAVEYRGENLSYVKLNNQANQLAHYLISYGVKPDDRIALCIERSTSMLVAILGILKSGGAYVPLDPVYSSQRLCNILQDAEPKFLLADNTGRKAIKDYQVPVIDLEKPLIADLPINNPDATKLGITSNNLAYVIYTSGSTGTPKGVMTEHQNAVQLFMSVHDQFGFNKKDKSCLFHSISFDVSVWEIWAALLYGGQLLIPPHNTIRSLDDEFYDWICIKGITLLTQTPSALKMLMRAKNNSSQSDHLRYIFFGSEASDPLTVKKWSEKCAKEKIGLIHMYGPTETTMIATSWKCVDDTMLLLPIGRPLPNRRIYLLDAHGEPVPLGAEGEIYISGVGVARGYLKRPELTAERFLTDPFNDDSASARMYRTGDRARYLPDGNLVYLGRTDQQVKIRGFRIELGEIESRLVEHPQVNEAVVQPNGNGSDTRLVAYLVTDSDAFLVQSLRSYLSVLLPEYMIPAAYVRLSSLPVTPNGKLDRRALPAPNDESFDSQTYEAPQGDIEEKLSNIWRELLNIERISRNDNFFALGGHSLLVAQLLAQLRQIGFDTTSVRDVFEAPTLAILASKLLHYQAFDIPPNLITTDSTKITPEMLPLINLTQEEINAIIAQVSGGVSNIQDIYELTPLQSGMLFHHLMVEEGDPYLVVIRLEFNDRTILERYAKALQQIIMRHDILRTVFIWDGLNEPAQVVLRKVPSLLTEISILDNSSSESILEQLSHKFNPRNYRLDLTQPPLLRLMTSSTSEGKWVALQLMHHLIADHITYDHLQAEIDAIFNDQNEKLTIPTQFCQVVAHARFGVNPAQHTRFFTEMLGDIDEPTLPFGLRDVVRDGTSINETHLILPQTLNDQLRAHARKLQVSLASICHLAWAKVIAQTSGCESVVFGTVLLGRLQGGKGNNSIMGPLINTLPIRLEIDEMSVESGVHRTHSRLSALLAHEYAPLVLAQRCSGILAGAPLFSSLLNYHHNHSSKSENASIPGISFIDIYERTNYPLVLSIEDDGNSLSLMSQVISSISAVRICSYMQQALESLADALSKTPQQSVRTLTVLPPEERTLLLYSWNKTTVTYPPACCLHQLFEAQVERDGQAIAVEYNGKSLTYEELNFQSNQLAHYLIARGVKPDDRIALCIQRSTKLIVAMLGILKAGGAYVPLDSKYSSQRLIKILQDSDPLFLLADAIGRNVLGVHRVPIIDSEESLPVNLSINNPDLAQLGLTPAHLAYIIYTSGSTGTPKGVMVEHRNVMNCLYWIKEVFKAEDFKHTSFSTSVNFDMSLYECFASLSMGTTLHIISDPLALTTTSNITILNTIPSAMTAILNSNSIPMSLRALHLAGEPLKSSLIKRILTDTKINELCNLYGQTETSFFATMYRYKSDDEIIETIGRPIGNTQIYLLDAHGEPVPIGAEGEMYIGGDSVARGYLKRPELTAERFLPDPFSDNPTACMYRTGDQARYLPDGNLVYLGRTDQQVKIRGFRIESGEIEARLVEHPQVHEAVVQPYGNGSDTQLVAYLVADSDPLLVQSLRSYLSALLPEYMVPAAYVRLSSLPRTPNGKLDRQALPAPDDESFARQQYEAPHGEMEEKLSNIWRELLSIERIGRHDNFFALGGHSLLVVRLLAQLRQIGLETTVKEIFDAPNLITIASSLAHYQSVTIPPNLITKDSTEITPEMLPLITLTQKEINAIIAQIPNGVSNIQDIYGLTPFQHDLWYHHIMSKCDDPYVFVSHIQFEDRSILERYVTALQHVIERNDIFRTAFIWENLLEPVQVVLRQVPSLLTEMKLDDSSDESMQLKHQFNPRHYQLNLTQAPLLRLIVAQKSDRTWTAIQLMHHIIFDRNTLQQLKIEIEGIFNGMGERLTTSFRQVMVQPQKMGINSSEHIRFFTQMLGDIDEPTDIFGLNDIDWNVNDINKAELMLPQILNDQLRSHARKLQVSLASICHLAWAQIISQTSGCESVVFGTVLLGRLQGGNDNIMGPMINILPLRLDIDETNVEIAVRNTHDRLSALLAHERAPLVLAQRCSGLNLADSSLFSSLLNYRHHEQNGKIFASLPGVNVIDFEERTNYPLAMAIEDDGNSLGLKTLVISSMSAAWICVYMQHTLKSIVDALTHKPKQSIRTLTVISPEERTLMRHNWNHTT